MPTRPTALVVSFSPIGRDSRVLRQLSVVSRHARVTTVGYGGTPEWSDEHVRIPDGAASLPQDVAGVMKLAQHRYRAAELAAPAARAAVSLVGDRTFDVVVANDARALPVAFGLARGAPVWADLHEWAPAERSHIRSWRVLVAPFMDHLCRTYLPRCAATTTVGPAIADLYGRTYGVSPAVMRNTSPWVDLPPAPVDGETIRIVHSGAAVPGRQLESLIDATAELGEGYSLDFYLVPANDRGRYLTSLRRRARDAPRVRVHPPVRPADLPAVLNRYDVGAYWIPPYSTNARLALPNKFFDFVQARLALAVGPSPEMAGIVDRYGLGVVSTGFDLAACVRSIRELTREQIAAAKASADRAARSLSFEQDAEVADQILDRVLGRR